MKKKIKKLVNGSVKQIKKKRYFRNKGTNVIYVQQKHIRLVYLP